MEKLRQIKLKGKETIDFIESILIVILWLIFSSLGFSMIKSSGQELKENHYIIMNYLGDSLKDLSKVIRHGFSLKTIC